jgi:tetratricopeptide (TPR) repeat protein
MLVELESARPLDESAIWRLHDAYFARRGLDAWREGEVPSYATSNYPAALQHVAFLSAALAARQGDDGPIHVLEVGCGSGAFAANFLRALAALPEAAWMRPRVRYLLSDYHAPSLQALCRASHLREAVADGQVVGVVLDLRHAEGATLLAGGALPDRIDVVIANYVTCVLPLKNLQKDGRTWREQHVAIHAEVPDEEADRPQDELLEAALSDPTRAALLSEDLALSFSWVARPLRAIYPKGVHRAVVPRVTAPHATATLSYPHGFIDFLEAIGPRLAPHGFVLVNDYGRLSSDALAGLEDRRPEVYGNSLANAVNFPVFDAYAAERRWGLVRTHAPEEILHTVALRPHGPWSDAERAAFGAAYVAQRGGDDVLDFWAAAHRHAEEGQHEAALRYWSRVLRLEPHHPDHYLSAGAVAIEAGRPELARALLEQGAALAAPEAGLDFAFHLGRAAYLLGDHARAVRHYTQSLAHDPHPTTWANLGAAQEALGDDAEAFRAYRAGLEADPAAELPHSRLVALRDRLWRETLARWEEGEVADPLADGHGQGRTA